jgi:putative Mn2+ efflux pump MntP
MYGLHLLSVLLPVSSSPADNVAVGIAFGIKRTNIPLTANLVIAALSGIGTLVSMLAGKTIAGYLEPKAATLLGGLSIIATGIWVTIQEMRHL